MTKVSCTGNNLEPLLNLLRDLYRALTLPGDSVKAFFWRNDMTTKEIAEAVGKAEKTVRTWAKKAAAKTAEAAAKLAEAQRSGGKPVDWTLDETIAIIETGMGKNAADIFRMNAEGSKVSSPAVDSCLNAKDIALISQIVSATVAETIKRLDGRMEKIETRIDQRAALLPAPQIKPRDNINKIVREWVASTGVDHRDAWNGLYRDFGYRTNTNPSICAKNRGMTILDYIEAEGQIDVLESVAVEIYGGAK